jgi:hypothetical protein
LESFQFVEARKCESNNVDEDLEQGEINEEAGDDEVYVYLTGVEKSFKEGLALFEELLANAKADDDAYREMVSGILKQRADAKLDKRTIMFRGLLNYGLYGERNPFTNIIPESDLAGINPVELCDLIKQLNNILL